MNAVGRFYIHKATMVLGTNNVMLYVKDANTLRISVLTGGQTNFKDHFRKIWGKEISRSSLSAVFYLAQLQTKERKLTKKIILE
jgi:hypothetical protein